MEHLYPTSVADLGGFLGFHGTVGSRQSRDQKTFSRTH